MRGDDHDPAHTKLLQVREGLADRGGVQVGQRGDVHDPAVAARGLLDRQKDACGTEERGVRRHHPDRPGPRRDESPGGGIRSIMEARDRVLDPEPGLRTHRRGVIDHPGDRLVGNACQPGNVVHHCRSSGARSLLGFGHPMRLVL